MANMQLSSMTAPEPKADDLLDKPYFFNISDEDDREDEPIYNKGGESVPSQPIMLPSKAPIHRPNYTPPVPETSVSAQWLKVDVSKVEAGSAVIHKAFGRGTVKAIEGARIIVAFQDSDKRFQFPGAFQQGFLTLG